MTIATFGRVSGHRRRRMSIIGSSVLLAAGLLPVSAQPSSAGTFTPVIEDFTVVKNGTTIFHDSFDNGVVPPDGPDGASTYAVYGSGGMTSESSGHLTMTPALGDPVVISGIFADTVTQGLRASSINPANDNFLGFGDAFEIHGLFNVSLPDTVPNTLGQAFGIRAADLIPGAPSNDIAQLTVNLNAMNPGQIGVRFADLNQQANTDQTAGFHAIDLTGVAFVELIISKAANSNEPTASFNLFDSLMNQIGTTGSLDNVVNATGLPITIYNGEDFTRAAFLSGDVIATPLPATLPLFASGAGLIGLASRRRKRKAAQAAV